MAARRKKKKSPAKADFTADFQTALIAALLRESELLTKYRRHLDPILFTNQKESEIVEAVLDVFDEEGKPPSIGLLSEILKDDFHWIKADAEEAVEYLTDLSIVGVAKRVGHFIKRQKTKDALIRGLELAERGNVRGAEAAVGDILGEAADNSYTKASYIKQAKERFDAYEAGEHEERITTGIKPLDLILNGGIARGELATVIGRAKQGKTTTLVNIGKGALLAGYKVVHITLELSLRKTMQKYDMSLAQVSKGGLFDNTEATLELYRDKTDDLDENALTVLFFPPDTVTLPTIERSFAYLKPDLILLDYGDLLVPSRKYDQSRHELAKIWRGMRAMAVRLNAGLWTATQLNRAGADKKTATGKDVAECWDKIAISDMILTLNQTPEEREKSRMRIFLSEGRDVEDHQTAKIYIDRARALIKGLKGDD